MYKVKRQLPGIYYAELEGFSYERLVKLRQDLVFLSDIYEEYKDVVIWKFSFTITSEEQSDEPSVREPIKKFIHQNPIDYGHTIVITDNTFIASIIKMSHIIFRKFLGDVSFANDLDEAIEMALLIQGRNRGTTPPED